MVEDLSEQRSLVQSTISNLKHSDDAQVGKEIAQYVGQSKAARQRELEQVQETLQTLSRRLQASRSRVEASKAQREEKSHAETMQDLEHERQHVEQGISTQAEQQKRLEKEIEQLEAELAGLDDDVEKTYAPDESILKLHILRGLGVEPLVNGETGGIDKVQVRSQASACVIPVDEQAQGHQAATQLWSLCSM
ncbi:hypothetical protein GGI12_002983 [Dipsacomyces acuminosporus]|nr:hypothetical protein GGI12_002983 [Dipsacomyces acuminosporus]